MNEMLKDSGWARHHDWQAVVMEPVTSWMCDAIGAAPGMTVLDAACGTGLPGLAIAQRLRPGGTLIAVDVSPPMLEAFRRNAARAGLENVEARAMSVAALDFADASFDAVTCKDGLMYCEPLDGARELRRVLKPGGRVAVTAWAELSRAAFFRTMFETLGRFMGAPPPDAPKPAPLRLSGPGVLEGVLREAGFANVGVEAREVVFSFDSAAMHFDVIRAMAAPVEAAVAALPAPKLADLKAAFAEALAPYTKADGRVRLPATALCASGSR